MLSKTLMVPRTSLEAVARLEASSSTSSSNPGLRPGHVLRNQSDSYPMAIPLAPDPIGDGLISSSSKALDAHDYARSASLPPEDDGTTVLGQTQLVHQKAAQRREAVPYEGIFGPGGNNLETPADKAISVLASSAIQELVGGFGGEGVFRLRDSHR